MRALSLLLIFFLPSVSFADRVWIYQGVYIEDVAAFTESNGYATMLVKIKGHDATGPCAPANAGYLYSKVSGGFGANMQVIYSTILSAQAQGVPVDFLIDESGCHTGSAYAGYPGGLGAKYTGVRINGSDN